VTRRIWFQTGGEGVVLAAVRADDPLTFGIDRLRAGPS